MLINPEIYNTFILELNNPLTEEQWDIIEDVDFDHTDHICFHTKHGKEVHFYKNAIPIEWLYQKRTLYLENECYMSLMVINEILNWWEKEQSESLE